MVLVTPVTFRLLHEVYRGAFTSLEASPAVLALVRFVLALAALGPATILMGATLPTLTRYLTRHADHLSEAFGQLYAANTMGAIVGTIVAGFILIELLGLTGTLLVGAACSGVVGIISITLDRRTVETFGSLPPPMFSAVVSTHSVPIERAEFHSSTLRLGLLVAALSGLTSLGYQTLWMRLLASGTGNFTYVFTMILALFLIGIALGAFVFDTIRPRIRSTVGLLAVVQLATAILAAAGGILIIPNVSTGILDLGSSPNDLFGSFLWTSALVCCRRHS